MQTFYKRFSVITGFLLLLVLLAANALVMRRQLGIQLQRQDWVSHTRQVLFQLTSIESLVEDAETGQRGFLYTGDVLPRFSMARGEEAATRMMVWLA